MSETLLSLITRYAVNQTSHSEESMRGWFAEHPDNSLNYILRTALPVEYCFDGLKHTFSRVEEDQFIQLVSTFWYLSDGEVLNTALRFNAKVVGNEINYQYSIVSATDFPEIKEEQKNKPEFMIHLISSNKWSKWEYDVIQS